MKITKIALSVLLASSLVVSVSTVGLAAPGNGQSKGKVEQSIEKFVNEAKQEKPNAEKKQEKLELKQEKAKLKDMTKEAIFELRQSVKAKYSAEEIEAVEKVGEELKSIDSTLKVLPVESVITKGKGAKIKLDTPPVIKSGRTLIPVRAITQGFGATLDWKPEEQKVTISYEDKEIILHIDSNVAYVNGEEVIIDAASSLYSNRTYVPLRFILETFDLKVDWDEETETIEIDEEDENLEDEEMDEEDGEDINTEENENLDEEDVDTEEDENTEQDENTEEDQNLDDEDTNTEDEEATDETDDSEELNEGDTEEDATEEGTIEEGNETENEVEGEEELEETSDEDSDL